MKKYNTRPFDFTGCHPVIAEHLKRGEAIECHLSDIDKEPSSSPTGFIEHWNARDRFYTESRRGTKWLYARPVTRKVRRIMPLERAIPVLIAEGWEFNDSGDLVGYAAVVRTLMFKMMGKPLSDPEVSVWAWPPCIIEEVEDDE